MCQTITVISFFRQTANVCAVSTFEQSLLTPPVIRMRACQAEGRRFGVCRELKYLSLQILMYQRVPSLGFFCTARFFPEIFFHQWVPFGFSHVQTSKSQKFRA